MVSLTLITALLFTSSWMSVSVCEFCTVEVQPGEDVELLCSNFTGRLSNIMWYKLSGTSNVSRISSMMSSERNATFFDAFQKEKFNMTSNITHIFLSITHVDFNDSGLYICGFNSNKNPVIVSAAYLNVQEGHFEDNCKTYLIMGAVFVCLIFITLLIIITQFNTGAKKKVNPGQTEDVDDDDVDDAALVAYSTTAMSRRRASQREVDTHVIYTLHR